MRLFPSVVVSIGIISAVAGTASAVTQHTVAITADGRDELRLVNGSMTVQHFSYDQPSGLFVDNSPKTLAFTNNTAAVGPVGIAGDYWVRKAVGRDGGYAVQRADGFALNVVDNPNGGDFYSFALADVPASNTTDWMFVRGAGGTPGRMSFAGQTGYVSRPAGSVTTFSMNLDGTEELSFVGGNLVVRHLSRDFATAITINGVTTPLAYTNNQSQLIPLNLPDQFQFAQTGGRGTLYPTQTPVGLLLGVPDELAGTDTYTWTITSVPEPASLSLLATGGAAALRRRRR